MTTPSPKIPREYLDAQTKTSRFEEGGGEQSNTYTDLYIRHTVLKALLLSDLFQWLIIYSWFTY